MNSQSTPARRQRRALDTGWSFRQQGEDAWLPAQVPGSNFTDLWRAGLIEDPYHGDAETRLQWVEQVDWDYRCSFDVAEADLSADSVELAFEGLDTFCEVEVNGEPLLAAENMFRNYTAEVKSRLRAGANELSLRFASPVRLGAERQAQEGFFYPAENDRTAPRASAYTRKAPYQFGWDWGPQYVTSGVWRPVRLDTASRARIRDTHNRIEALDDARAQLCFEVELESLGVGQGVIEITCDQPEVAAVCHAVTLGMAGERQIARMMLVIDAPRRWWPNGLGEAFLYGFDIVLRDADDIIDVAHLRVGLRTLRVRNEPDEHGENFLVEVNGRPVFMKGANHIPGDSFPERMTDARYRQLFRDAVAANMNMLRVWGGGTYESDLFHDLADEHGILIWQDFMFSCSLYPADDAFLANVAVEAEQNIRRLRRHPSLALWCGNNETSLGIAHWDWPEKFGYSEERYAALLAGNSVLFDGLLRDMVAQHDSERFYMASSPIGFWNDPSDDARGDSHYWGVWHGELPFASYADRVPRFMSEYGFQSYPALSTVALFTDPTDRNVGSAVLRQHQKHSRGDAIIGRTIREIYGEPRDFDAFCYLSQLAQADGLQVAFEAHRRAMPYCMGSLYWQFGDCWPAISWSGIDYYGQWKALHYQAARSFAPLIISVEPHGDELALHLVSDLREDTTGTLRVRLIDFYGECRWEDQASVAIAGNSASVVHNVAAAAIVDPTEVVIETTLTLADGTTAARDVRMLCDPVAATLPDPKLSVTVIDGKAVVHAERFARAVYLRDDPATQNAATTNLHANFFDMIAGETREIPLEASASLIVSSVWDACRPLQAAAARRVAR